MKKIKVQSRIPFIFLILFTVVLITIAFFLLKSVWFDNDLSFRLRSDSIVCVYAIFAFLPFLYNSLKDNKEYVSDIIIKDNNLFLVYKVKNKTIRKEKIFLDDIKKFEIYANLYQVPFGKSKILKAEITTRITKNNEEVVMFNNNSDVKILGCVYQYILDIQKISSVLPGFKIHLKGRDEYAIANINYFLKFKKKLPLWYRIKHQFKLMQKYEKITLAVAFLIFIVFCILFTYFSFG